MGVPAGTWWQQWWGAGLLPLSSSSSSLSLSSSLPREDKCREMRGLVGKGLSGFDPPYIPCRSPLVLFGPSIIPTFSYPLYDSGATPSSTRGRAVPGQCLGQGTPNNKMPHCPSPSRPQQGTPNPARGNPKEPSPFYAFPSRCVHPQIQPMGTSKSPPWGCPTPRTEAPWHAPSLQHPQTVWAGNILGP